MILFLLGIVNSIVCGYQEERGCADISGARLPVRKIRPATAESARAVPAAPDGQQG